MAPARPGGLSPFHRFGTDPWLSIPTLLARAVLARRSNSVAREFVPELEKLQRMVEGEQRVAALDLVGSLLEKYPDRACLLATKFSLQADLGETEQAAATAAPFPPEASRQPGRAGGMAVSIAGSDAPGAARLLQQAIEKAGDQLPLQVYDALSVVGVALFGVEAFAAAGAHWMLQFSFSGGKDEQVLRLIMQLQGSAEIPLLWKDDLQLAECPADALWRGSFEAAMTKARTGHWLAAADELAALGEKAGRWPAICRNLAILRTWLAQKRRGGRRLARAGRRPDSARRRRRGRGDGPVARSRRGRVVRPGEGQLSDRADRRAAGPVDRQPPIAGDPGRFADAGRRKRTTPQGILLAARPSAARKAPQGLTVDAVPRIIGQVLVFGKQTDREARAELIASRKKLAQAREAFEAIAGKTIRPAAEEEVCAAPGCGDDALALEWYLPADIAPAERRQLLQAGHRQRLLVEWPEMPQKLFGGKTPARGGGRSEDAHSAAGGDFGFGAGQRSCWSVSISTSCAATSACPKAARSIRPANRCCTLPLVRLAAWRWAS